MPSFAAELRQGWKALIGWIVGLAAVCVVYLPFFESIGASPEMEAMLASLPRALVVGMGFDTMFTGAGYVHSSILELTALILAVIAGIGWGARAIAGDEEEGMLELTLAHGVSRARVYTERALAIVVRFLILGAALWAILMGSSAPFSLDLDAARTLAAVTSFTALAIMLSFLSLAVGAATGNKGAATGTGAGIAVAAYVMNVIGRQSEDWAWLSEVSPFGWAFAEIPIMTGWDWTGLALLDGLSVLAFLVGLVGLRRRDVLCG